MKNPNDAIDDLETLLLFAMDSPPPVSLKWIPENRLVDRKPALQIFRFDDKTPSCAYTFDAMDDDRELTTDFNMLINHPSEIIGDGAETLIIDHESNVVKWMRIEPCSKPKKGFATIGKADKWFAAHYRVGDPRRGWTDYIKAYTAVSKTGSPVPVKWMQQSRYDNLDIYRDADQIIMTCSIIEDAHRSNSFLVSSSIGSEIRFPVGYDAYRSFFDLRDAPRNTPTGKRNPILHWVSQHIRRTKKGNETTVKKHLRGSSEVEIDGIKASITPN